MERWHQPLKNRILPKADIVDTAFGPNSICKALVNLAMSVNQVKRSSSKMPKTTC